MGDTKHAYRVWLVAVAPNVALSVVSAVFALVVEVFLQIYAAESRSHPPSAYATEKGAVPVLCR